MLAVRNVWDKGMRTVWYVKTKLFDNGEVKKTLHELKCDKKPQDSFVEKELFDEYRNYFDTYCQ